MKQSLREYVKQKRTKHQIKCPPLSLQTIKSLWTNRIDRMDKTPTRAELLCWTCRVSPDEQPSRDNAGNVDMMDENTPGDKQMNVPIRASFSHMTQDESVHTETNTTDPGWTKLTCTKFTVDAHMHTRTQTHSLTHNCSHTHPSPPPTFYPKTKEMYFI